MLHRLNHHLVTSISEFGPGYHFGSQYFKSSAYEHLALDATFTVDMKVSWYYQKTICSTIQLLQDLVTGPTHEPQAIATFACPFTI